MCSNFDPVAKPERMRLHFGVDTPGSVKPKTWPLYEAPFIRKHPNADVGDEAVPMREALSGQFGLLPHWAGEIAFGRRTTPARRPSLKNPHIGMPGNVRSTASFQWRRSTSLTGAVAPLLRPGFSGAMASLWASLGSGLATPRPSAAKRSASP